MKNQPVGVAALTAALLLIFTSSRAATITWNNTSGGNWNVPANWTPAQVPGKADTVEITTPGTYVVIVNDAESDASVTIGGGAGTQTLQIASGGVLNNAGGSVANTGSLMVQAGGSLNVASSFSVFGPLTNAGTMNLTNASISIYNNGGASYSGGIDNPGQMNLYGSSGDHFYCDIGDEYFNNEGAITVAAGTGTCAIEAAPGTLAGTYNASSGTAMQFSGGTADNPLSVGSAPTLNGPGLYQFNGGTLLLTSDTIPNLSLTGGTLELGPAFQQGGAITNLTLDGIALLLAPYEVNGTLRVTNSALHGSITVNSGGVFDNSGGTVSSDATVMIASGGTLNVISSMSLFGVLTNAGTVNLTNASITIYNNSTPSYLGGMVNQGVINFYGGSGDHISSEFGNEYLMNEGTINEQAGAGVSSLNAYFGVLSGTYNAAVGTTVQFVGGSAAAPLMVGTPPVLNGPGLYQFTSGTIVLDADQISGLALTGGTLELGPSFQQGGAITNLTLDGITLSPAAYQVTGMMKLTNSTVNGTLTVSSGGVLDTSAASVSGAGSLLVEKGGTLNLASALTLYGALTNAGTMNLTNASVAIYNNNTANYAGGIDNEGAINLYGGSGDHISSEFGNEYLTNGGNINQEPGTGISTINAYFGALSGTYNAALGTTVQFIGGTVTTPLSVETPPVLNGPGQYEFVSGYIDLTVDIVPNLALTGGTLELGPSFQQGGVITNLTVDGITLAPGAYELGGTMKLTGATLNGTLTVNSGAVLDGSGGTLSGTGGLIVEAGGVLNLASSMSVYGPMTNAGTMNLTNANIALYNNNTASYTGGIENLGVINLYGSSGDHISSSFGDEYFINQGTVNQETGAGTSTINAYIGSLAGTYNANANTILQFSGGTADNPLTVETPPILNGPGQYQFTSGYVLLNMDTTPNLELIGGTLELGPSFQASGAIENLVLDGIALGAGNYTVNGTLKVTNSTLNGTIMVNSGGVLDTSAATIAAIGSVIIETGAFLNISVGLSTYGLITNAGTMDMTNANLALYNNNTANYAGGLANSGVINLYGASGDQIVGEFGDEYFINQGTLSQRPRTGNSTVSIANLSDPGEVDSEENTLTFNNLPLQSSSVLTFGLNSASDYGKIAVQTAVVLAGAVNASFNNDYVPANGAEFNVMSGTAFSGTFANVGFPAGTTGEGVYNSTTFGLMITSSASIQPLLTITRVNANTVTVSWPASAANFNLQTKPSLGPGTWTDITAGIATVGANFVWTTTVAGEAAFFRLQSQ